MINIFAYALNVFRAAFIWILSVTMVGQLVPAGRDHTFDIDLLSARYTARAQILTRSIERTFYNRRIPMLHNSSRNHFTPSGAWDAAALLTLYTQMARLNGESCPRKNPYIRKADRVIFMLGFYARNNPNDAFPIYTGTWSMFQRRIDTSRPGVYVYYDDNMWIGRDLVKLYNLTGNTRYLDHAIAIADMLIDEGWDYLEPDMFTQHFGQPYGGPMPEAGPMGGFYWRCDKAGHFGEGMAYRVSMNVCSNGPVIQFLVMLANALDDEALAEHYVSYAMMSYRFLRYIERPDGVFADRMYLYTDADENITGIHGRIGGALTYNSGTPISSAIELYRRTGEAHFLEDAIRWGRAAHAYFPRQSTVEGLPTFLDLPWFREILLMGYIDLYPHYPGALAFIQVMENALNHGYEHHRLRGVLGFNQNHIPRNWVDGFADNAQKQNGAALEQIPNAGIYAALAMFYASRGE